MTTQIGTALNIGVTAITGYCVEQSVEGQKEVDSEIIFDDAGAVKTILVYRKDPKQDLTLIALSGTTAIADFPPGELAAHASFTSFYVLDTQVTNTKSAQRVTVSLINYAGIP